MASFFQKDSLMKGFSLAVKSFYFVLSLSFFFHALFYLFLSGVLSPKPSKNKVEPVTLEIVSREKKQVIETPQTENEKKPKNPHYLADKDNDPEEQTKVRKRSLGKALDPGHKRGSKKKTSKSRKEVLEKKKAKESNKKGSFPLKKKTLSHYKSLLESSRNLLSSDSEPSFEDILEEDLKEGERINLSTSKFRYIGYFTNIRKTIELIWTYPVIAGKEGKQGVVTLEFTILKTGEVKRIKILKTSGYKILDTTIVEAIQEASPFPALPKTFKKEQLTIEGNFSYVLSGYSSY